ncbi:hypothetical protein [Methanobrevibacter sp. DSM 116169]|uniref:hypothetical protein n=1 Tax=Methanobrevibacter sp. DSM 116169 TaxID=3242727 RepID=UPI0038FC79EA
MSLVKRVRSLNTRLVNAEPNAVKEIGKDSISTCQRDYGEDWINLAPEHIKPSIKNCRKAAGFPTVAGILNNLIIKILSSFTIKCEEGAEKAKEHILEQDKVWELKKTAWECIWKNLVDGEPFYEYVYKDNHVRLRCLAFDGEKYLIKKIYDDYGDVEGYLQKTWVNTDKTDWKTAQYSDIKENLEEKTIAFGVDQVTNPVLIEIDGEGRSIVKNVIDLAFFVNNLYEQMPSIIFKAANTMVVTVGNENRREKFDEKTKEMVTSKASDYHQKGVIVFPYGVKSEMIGTHLVPDIPSYVKSMKSAIYEGLITPESLYSSESSNRSTAQVQLTDTRTGHVLFIEYAQEFLKKWLERDLIDKELELNGFKAGSVWIDFNPEDIDLDTNYLEAKEDDLTISNLETTEKDDLDEGED